MRPSLCNNFSILILLICKLQYAISNSKPVGQPDKGVNAIIHLRQGNEAVVVEPIPGTDLKTGVFYTIELADYRSDDGGFMTISPDHFDGEKRRNHVKLDKSDDFKEGGKLHEHAQWLFIKSEVPGYYEIANRHYAKYMICMGRRSTSGFFVVAFKDGATSTFKLDDYGKGKKKRNEALWKFVKRGSFYTIELLKFKSVGGGQMNPRGLEIEGGKSNPVQVYDSGPSGRKFAKDEMFMIENART